MASAMTTHVVSRCDGAADGEPDSRTKLEQQVIAAAQMSVWARGPSRRMAPTRLSPVVGYHLESSQWLRFADLTITPAYGKPSHGRSLPIPHCGVGHVVRLALHGRGRENSPSRPYDSGMTVVDRPTISGQFLGRFHAHSLPNNLRMPVSTVTSHEPKRARRSARGEAARHSFSMSAFNGLSCQTGLWALPDTKGFFPGASNL